MLRHSRAAPWSSAHRTSGTPTAGFGKFFTRYSTADEAVVDLFPLAAKEHDYHLTPTHNVWLTGKGRDRK